MDLINAWVSETVSHKHTFGAMEVAERGKCHGYTNIGMFLNVLMAPQNLGLVLFKNFTLFSLTPLVSKY